MHCSELRKSWKLRFAKVNEWLLLKEKINNDQSEVKKCTRTRH